AQGGLSALVQIVAARSQGNPGDSMIYLVTTPDGLPLAGNLTNWPAGAAAKPGPLSFTIETKVKGREQTHPARGALIVIPEGYRLLVGRDITDATEFRERVKLTLFWSGLLALGAGLAG